MNPSFSRQILVAAVAALLPAAHAAAQTFTPLTIPAIQGSGATSPHVGATVETTGVVTRVNNNGFFMQDELGDNNPATSDGIFVFTSTAPTVQAGDRVRVRGRVTEFAVGTGPTAVANPVTQLTTPTITVLASGIALPPLTIAFPEAAEGDLERYEGMLVRIAGPLVVSQNYFLGRYGQLTLAHGERLEKATNRHPAGSPEALALNADNALRRILLDDGRSTQNPNPTPYLGSENTVRAGDRLPELVGALDYGLATNNTAGPSDYRIHPTVAPVIARANPRPTAAPAVGGNLKVAGFNLLNYFTTIDQSGAACFPSMTRTDCRGADSAAEFARQQTKLVAALRTLDADVVGLMELENNGETAVNALVTALNAALGGPVYASVGVPENGTGTDAIRLGLIYKPARLTPLGRAVSATDPVHNRPPLAQFFSAPNGERFGVVVNHFKSKSSCPTVASDPNADRGDGQGCWNARRVEQAVALDAFINDLKATRGSGDMLIVGDLNAYGKEDPILELARRGYDDLIERHAPSGYSYVFDGEAGRLDHALASASLAAKVAGAAIWHINADEPAVIDYNLEFKQPACSTCGPDYYTPTAYRSSDHDPVLVGLNLVKRIDGTGGRDTLTGTPGDDVLTGGPGADLLAGGAGNDRFVYLSPRDAIDTIVDFVPGEDRIDLSALLAGLGVAPADALATGHVRLVDTPQGASLQIDVDGAAGPALARPLVILRGVGAAQIQPARDLVFRAMPNVIFPS